MSAEIDPNLSVRCLAARDIARDVLRRRAGGQDVSDASVLAEHDELRPELAQELRKLAVIQRAAAVPRAEGSSVAATRVILPPDALNFAPDRIPGYEVIREIARGGQGAVYEALQHGTRRRVAIKLIHRGGSAAARDLARFEREVQILAALKHPSIVTVYESGMLGSDAYFVMEYIDGLPLDQAITEDQPRPADDRSERDAPQSRIESPRNRVERILGLFAQICEAVEAAHLRGVIHRDLKPANIRVTTAGQAFILDFGLAKVSEQFPQAPGQGANSSDASSANWSLDAGNFTETGQFVGSLPWSSPEQAAGRVHEIDLRTDVYALGVMLYQALAGRFPYEVRGPLPGVIDRILHADAAPLRQGGGIDRDLEALVLRCLAKEPARRYQSAGEVARDLRRYLAGDAIDARRDSAGYLLRKAMRRHRVAFSVGAGFVLLITAATIVLAVQAQQIRRERDLARQARDAEHVARVSSERVTDFLEDMFASADPFADPEHRADITLLAAVDQSAGGIEQRFADEPLIEASVRTVLGRTYRELGAYEKADANFARALELRDSMLEPGHSDLADTLHEWAVLRQAQTSYVEADELCLRALAIRIAAFGEVSPAVAASRNLHSNLLRELNRLDKALDEARAALAIRRAVLPDDDAAIAESLNALGLALRKSSRLDEASDALNEALARRKRALGDNHPDVATTLNNLAALRIQQGLPAEAAERLTEALSIYRARLGDSHPYLAPVLTNLGSALARTGKLTQAEESFREALAIRRAARNGDDADAAVIEYQLGGLLDRMDRTAEAHSLLVSTVAELERSRGIQHTMTQRAIERLIGLCDKLDDADRAAELRSKLVAREGK